MSEDILKRYSGQRKIYIARDMEWELSKENVQPLKTGRNVDVLNDALKAKAEGLTCSSVLEHQRRQLLEAIENYVGNDPLQPWIRCIKWVNDAFPAGGAQSELLKLLEGCTRKFQKEELYRRDVRYLRVWVQYADCCPDPSDVFAFLEAHEIGQDYALFYEAYATSMEVRRNFSKAEEIYQLGLQRSAQPLGRLESMYKGFLHRMLRRGERKMREDQQLLVMGSAGNSESDVQLRAFGPTASYAGDLLEQQAQKHRARQIILPPHPRANRSENGKLSVYVDPEFESLPRVTSTQEVSGKNLMLSGNQAVTWSHLASIADKTKENAQLPIKWSDAKITQKARSQLGHRTDLDVLVDEEFAEVSSQKPHINSNKSSAPTLRLRLEAMDTKRHATTFRGSFLDFPEANYPAMPLDSFECQPESSRGGPTESATARRLLAEPIFGYDTSLLIQNGRERSFEEVRLSNWNETQQVLYRKEQADSASNIASPEKLKEALNSVLSSINEEFCIAGGHHLSSEGLNVTSNRFAANVALSNLSSKGKIKSDNDPSNSREDLLGQSFSQEDVSNSNLTSFGGLVFVDDLMTEPAAAREDVLTHSEVQRQTNGLSTSPEEPAIVNTDVLGSFSTYGDETVAIKRFAEEVIVHGSDTKVSSLESVSHNGLIEPTINTKEALADILDMFNKPLECDNARPKANVPKDRKRASNFLDKSRGFQIFVDEDLNAQSTAKLKEEERVKAPSGEHSVGPVVQTGSFYVFADENLDVRNQPDACKNSSSSMVNTATSRPSQSCVFDDEDLSAQGSDSLKITKNRKASFSESTADTVLQSGRWDVFKDENLTVQRPTNANRVGMSPKASLSSGLKPKSIPESVTLQKIVNKDLIPERSVELGELFESSTEKSPIHLGIYVDHHLRGLSLNQLDDMSMKDQCLDKFSLIEDEAEAIFNGTAPTLELQTTSDALNAVDESNGASSERSLEPKTCKSSMLLIGEVETNSPRKFKHIHTSEDSEIAQMMVNPWDESIFQDRLMRLKPHLSDCEDFVESNEKYSGSISLQSLRNSNVRNKILKLGNSTYRLKGCIGRGAFAQVFEAEDEEDDFFDDAPKLALKFQMPGCPWEFFIYRQLDMRISTGDRCYYGHVRRFHLYRDSSFMICDYGEKGTLQDVVNAYLGKGQRMDEVLCMFYTIEMLRMLEVLHGVGIIHGDFKPDNLLIRDNNDELEAWAADRPGCWKYQGLSLIDWGRSIDITLYPKGTHFKGDCKTDSFRCPEMLENRPWTFQVDTFGLCVVVHCLLHGNYMQLEKTKTKDARTKYQPRAPFKRYWNVELWRGLFHTLLNVNNHREDPPLTALRHAFEGHLINNALGTRVKEQLAKQRIMMFTRG